MLFIQTWEQSGFDCLSQTLQDSLYFISRWTSDCHQERDGHVFWSVSLTLWMVPSTVSTGQSQQMADTEICAGQYVCQSVFVHLSGNTDLGKLPLYNMAF